MNIETLIARARTGDDQAIFELGRTGDPRALTVLGELLRTTRGIAQLEVVRAIANNFPEEQASPYLEGWKATR
jgi:hypothetical protein